MVLLFTLPPNPIEYPYVLTNANNPSLGRSYISRHSNAVREIIIDSGVEIFRDPNVFEYPGGAEKWIDRLVDIYDELKNIARAARIHVTCPDYPDDYHPKRLWLSSDLTNIERTIMNIVRCIDWYSDIPWLIPVQGWFGDPRSLEISLEYLDQLGVLDRYRYLAIANLCVERSPWIARETIDLVTRWLEEHGYRDIELHVFGLKIPALRLVAQHLRSFDSVSWTRPVSTRLRNMFRWSAKSLAERILFFCEYLIHVARYGVEIPIEAVQSCMENLHHAEKELVARYRDMEDAISRIVCDIIDSFLAISAGRSQPPYR